MVEKRNQELKSKLTDVEKGKRSAEAALDNAERQAKVQRVLLHQAEDQLVISKEQIISLKKKLEKVEKAKDQAEKDRDQAEQDRYNVGVVEIEEALKAEVLGYVGTTASKYGMKLSTKLGLRLLLYLGRQRVYTTILPFEHLARPALGLISPLRWQKWAWPVQPRS